MILVFAGAGASKAVSPEQYPTTEEFFRRLPAAITEHPLFDPIASFVRQKTQNNAIDIEQWLWASAEVLHVLRAIGDKDHPAGWLFDGDRLPSLVGKGGDLRHTLAMGSSSVRALEKLEDLINRQIYDLYRARPMRDALDQTWVPLLSTLAKFSEKLEIFTTNYDIVLEEAIEASGIKIETGRRRGTFSELNESLWIESDTEPDQSSRSGLLTKLHGSVDWSRNGEQIYFGTPRFQGNHADQVIIYPGFKGVPEQRPFTLFHEHFARTVQGARAVVFIGFAFRDQYINQIFRDRLARMCPVIIVNPAELYSIPFSGLGQVRHLRMGLDVEAVTAVEKILAPLGTV